MGWLMKRQRLLREQFESTRKKTHAQSQAAKVEGCQWLENPHEPSMQAGLSRFVSILAQFLM
jgi:hypothetical protein